MARRERNARYLKYQKGILKARRFGGRKVNRRMAARKLKPQSPESTPQNNRPGGNTSWKTGIPERGWYKMPDQEWWRDLPRLQRGLYQRMLIDYAWGCTVPRETGKPIPEWSPWLSYVEMAEQFRCSPEQLRDDGRDAASRGLIAVEEIRGKVRFRILWERWPNIKDYVAPRPQLVEKPEKKTQVRWLSRAVSVNPGETIDLPRLDFAVERISLRNTSAEGTIKIGAGSCEGGVLVLETEASVSSVSKKRQELENKERDSTPASFADPSPKKSAKIDPIVAQIGEAISTYGPITQDAVAKFVTSCHAEPVKVLEALSVVHPPENSDRPVGWILTMVPRYLAGSYQPKVAKKKSERERLADEIWGGGKKSA